MAVTNHSALAQLGVTTGEFWLNKYPLLVLNSILANDYLVFHQNYRTLVLEQSNVNSERRKLTNVLSKINIEITFSTKFIKNYLEEEYGKDAKSYYKMYGLVYERKNFGIASQNDNRMQSLDILVSILEQPNNSIAIQKYGLIYWKNLRDIHRSIWTIIKNLDGTISINSGNLKIMYEQAILLQKSLRAQIRIDYFDNYKHIIRDFGFQEEKY